jgi:hypothetical protein
MNLAKHHSLSIGCEHTKRANQSNKDNNIKVDFNFVDNSADQDQK